MILTILQALVYSFCLICDVLVVFSCFLGLVLYIWNLHKLVNYVMILARTVYGPILRRVVSFLVGSIV